jgi:glycosyltransferase involved in cell wall biosynthesis
MPTVGIVVPVFNALPWLHEALRSIRRQTLSDWCCVLVDDGSVDGSAAVCDQAAGDDSRIRAVHQENTGVCAARNAGSAALRECEFWSFMDQDDVWRPDALDRLTRAARQPGVIGAHCLAETIGTEGQTLPGFADFQRSRTRPGRRRLEPVPVTEPTTLDMTLLLNRVYPPGVLIARAGAYRAAGPWDTRFGLTEDWDMLLRLLEQGSLAFVDERLVGYRRHATTASGLNYDRKVAENRAVQVAAFARLAPSLGRRRLRSWWRQWERLKLAEAAAELPSARGLARVAIHAWRYARGWPRTRSLAESARCSARRLLTACYSPPRTYNHTA